MKRKILSLALALMMVISVAAALPVSAEVADIRLDIADLSTTDSSAANYTNESTIYTDWAISEVDWILNGNAKVSKTLEMNGNSMYAKFTVDIKQTGSYDLHLAIGGSGVSTEVTIDNGTLETFTATSTGSISTLADNKYRNVVLTEGIHTITIGATANGVVYFGGGLLKFVSATDFVVRAKLDADTTVTGHNWGGYATPSDNAAATSGVDWAPRGIDLLGPNTNLFYNANILETGWYIIKFAAGKYSTYSSAKLDFYDGETKIVSGHTIGVGSTETANAVETVVSQKVYLEQGPHTFRIDGTALGAYIYGFKLEKTELTADDLRVIVPINTGTGTHGDYAGASTNAPNAALGWIPSGRYLLGAKTDLTYTVNILADGYYDIYMAVGGYYQSSTGATYKDLNLSLDLYDGSEVLAYNCQTNNLRSTAANDAKEILATSAYLTKGEHTFKVDGRTGNDWVFGFKFEYTGTTKTEFIIDAASPQGMGSSYFLGNYGINNIEWCDYGTTNLVEAGYLEYDLHVSDAGYYTVTLALNSTAGYCDVYVDGVLYTTSADINVNSGSTSGASAETGAIDVAKVYLSAGDHTLKITPPAVHASACLIYNIKVAKDAVQPEVNEIRMTNTNCAAVADGSYAGTDPVNEICAEVMTTANAKVFIVNYQDLGDGLMKMANFAEGEVVVKDGSIKIVRTSSIDTTAGTVKAFLWDGTTFAPIAMNSITVVAKPTPVE